ncbi:MAG TPA: bifunctional diaminohydroxyphosphoribosylaminopyrimidine deaminase/5-amino-6-(5-phosphoribosylamino)uracil reductase RibD [Burkholderiales bacterium]|jgi:diaminohydroxyphosphoribosylaminopyrimidine deaminase/5-amino-6-(5-phosphoribosylamino)uracil reductase|nr:bifunctional diaminohydroxyphosphoribosylaminopyrimidine deaminase/5-amino-6-(5-phosphoribosylamino)uracil reductase RibD [Burkholderiales bacterium]
MFTPDDHRYMARALELGERGLYTTTPNPRVGCVVVRECEVVGEGWHEKAGGPHAEVNALQAAGARARGSTVYVTLEPCAHHGRTPPCVDALLAAGVTRVVAAMKDPYLNAGDGLALLERRGVAVASGLLGNEARELNVGFVTRLTRGRPWVRMKVAASLDGKTALSNGRSQWITGEAARRDGHHWRARACAVLTGIGTVKDDDPRLTARDVATTRQPLRIVVDSRLETPLTARVLEGGNVLVAAASEHRDRIAALQEKGAEVVVLPNAAGKVELPDLFRELARRELNEIHVEAGHKLNGSLLNEGMVDELVLYLAPNVIGDAARGMFNLPELTDLSGRRQASIRDVRMIGGDIRVLARFV